MNCSKAWECMASSVEEASGQKQEEPTPRLQIYSTSDTVSPFWRGLSVRFALWAMLGIFIHSVLWLILFLLHPLFAEKYEREAKKYWDVFYKRHQDRVCVYYCPCLLYHSLLLHCLLPYLCPNSRLDLCFQSCSLAHISQTPLLLFWFGPMLINSWLLFSFISFLKIGITWTRNGATTYLWVKN